MGIVDQGHGGGHRLGIGDVDQHARHHRASGTAGFGCRTDAVLVAAEQRQPHAGRSVGPCQCCTDAAAGAGDQHMGWRPGLVRAGHAARSGRGPPRSLLVARGLGDRRKMLDEVMPDPRRRRGLMLVMSSPSGAGKTSISRRVLELEPELALSISVTTRPQRPGEIDGVHYLFMIHRSSSGCRCGRVARARACLWQFLRHAACGCRGGVRRWARTCCSTSTGRGPSSSGRPRPTTWSACSSCRRRCAELERRLKSRAQDSDETVRLRLAQVRRRHPLGRVRLRAGEQGIRG